MQELIPPLDLLLAAARAGGRRRSSHRWPSRPEERHRWERYSALKVKTTVRSIEFAVTASLPTENKDPTTHTEESSDWIEEELVSGRQIEFFEIDWEGNR